MLEAGLEGVEFIAINTDTQALAMCEADHKLHIGKDLTKGLGGGSDPKVGRDAALAAYDEIKNILKGSDMVFVTAGEGGGTGTGAAPFTSRDEYHVAALEDVLDLVVGRERRVATDFRVGPATQSLGQVLADVKLVIGLAHGKRLGVGVDGNELHAFKPCLLYTSDAADD